MAVLAEYIAVQTLPAAKVQTLQPQSPQNSKATDTLSPLL